MKLSEAKWGYMLKNIKHLLKKTLVTNFALGLIALPTTTISQSEPQPSLIIPEAQLNVAFDVQTNKIASNEPKIQIPIEFIYMSQGFTAFHPGVDLATKFGTPIKPVMAGTVEMAGYSPFGYGNEIVLDNGDGVETLYAHLSKIEVKEGDEVDMETEIGLVGSTGHSTGPHLHLEVHKNGKPINPVSFLPPLKTEELLSFN